MSMRPPEATAAPAAAAPRPPEAPGVVERTQAFVREKQRELLPSLIPGPTSLQRLVPNEGRSFSAGVNAGVVQLNGTGTTAPVSAEPGKDPRVNVEVRTELNAGPQAQIPFVAGAGVTIGGAVTTQLQIPPNDFRAMRAGEKPFPDVMDPRTLPDNSEATIRAEFTSNVMMGSRLPGPGLISGFNDTGTQSHGRAVNIERNGNTVTVTAGDTAALQRSLALRTKLAPGAELSASTELRNSQGLERRQFDVSTEQGRRDYQQFVRDSLSPRPPDPAAQPLELPRTSEQPLEQRLEVQQRTAIATPGFLPFQASFELSRTEVERTQRRNDQGTEIQTRARADDVTLSSQTQLNHQGEVVSQEAAVRFNNLHPATASYLREAFGQDPAQGPRDSVELRLNRESLTSLQDRLRQAYPENRRPHLPPPQRALVDGLLAARSPEQAAAQLLRMRNGSWAGETLLGARAAHPQRLPLPGEVR